MLVKILFVCLSVMTVDAAISWTSSSVKDNKLYSLKSAADNMAITSKSKNYEPGSKIRLDVSHNDSTQLWLAVESATRDQFIIVSKHQKYDWSKIEKSHTPDSLPPQTLVLTTDTNNGKNPVLLQYYDGKAHQSWKFAKLQDNQVLIRNAATDACLINPVQDTGSKKLVEQLLKAAKRVKAKKPRVKLADCDETDERQKWILKTNPSV